MNLTSKRMLRFLSVCAGAFALTATAQTIYVSDNFEAEGVGYTNAAIGDAAGMYKANVWDFDAVTKLTNLVWNADAGDASTIQAFEGSYTNGRPITNDNAKAQALKLETVGQTLTRYVAFTQDDGSQSGGVPLTTPTPVSFQNTPVFVDTLIKFTPSEDDPAITDPNVKVAIFVNVNSNLVVCHKSYNGAAFYATNSVFEAMDIDPEHWYRLTLMLAYAGVGFYTPAFEIYLDGVKLTHANGAVDTSTYSGGSWFFSLSAGAGGGGDVELNQISFQGTGYVDDLVVADAITPFTGVGLTLTLAFDDDLMDVLVNGSPVTPNAEVVNGATLAIDAKDWYQISSITGDGIGYTGDTGAMINESTGTISTDIAGRTATINVAQYASGSVFSTSLGAPYDTLPANDLAAWADAYGVTEAAFNANAADYLDNYLLNIDEAASAQLEVTSIELDDVNSVAIITVGATGAPVDFTDLNGTVVVWTTENLATSFSNTPVEYPFEIIETGATEVTIAVPYPAGNFIKARVE